jgi:hypothetical protein
MVNMALKLGNFLEICVFLQDHKCPRINTPFLANIFAIFGHQYTGDRDNILQRRKESGLKTIVAG